MEMLIGQTPQGQAGADPVMDGDQKTFMQDVVNASREVPILVDFWATWCGPCKTLTPLLEKVVRSAQGRVRLVKIDIDKNRQLVQQLAQLGLPLQSVPTVAAFWQGQIADLFQGALPEREVKSFIENLLKLAGGQMPSADLMAEAKAALEGEDAETAAELFRAVLEGDPAKPEAIGGLARALLALGQDEEALATVSNLPANIADHAEIAGARSAILLAAEGRKAASELAQYESALAADPANHQARLDLATALNGMGRREEAAGELLEIIRRDRKWNDEAARLQLLKFFEAWGFDDAATTAARRRLSTLLFS